MPSDYLQLLAQTIAQARPQAQVGGRGPVILPPTGTRKEGYGSLGESIGGLAGTIAARPLGNWLDRKFNREKMAKEAEQAREIALKMPDETRQALTTRRDVQKRRLEQAVHAPELFTDAAEVWGDESMFGYLEFAPQVRTPEERVIRKEAGKAPEKTQVYREREAGIVGREAGAAATRAGTKVTKAEARIREAEAALAEDVRSGRIDINTARERLKGLKAETKMKEAEAERAPLETERLTEEIGRLREEIKSVISERRIAEERAPAEKAYIEAHTAQVREQSESYDAKAQAEVDKLRRKENFKELNTTYKIYFDELAKLREDSKYAAIGDPLPVASGIVTKAQGLVNTLGYADFDVQQEDGGFVHVSLPKPLLSPQGSYAVNQALNEAYTAFSLGLQREADPKTLLDLYSKALQLYNNVFGMITADTIRYIPPEVQTQTADLRQKMEVMKYTALFRLSPPPQEEEAREAWIAQERAAAQKLGVNPRPEPKGWLWHLIRPWSWTPWTWTPEEAKPTYMQGGTQ